MRIFLAFIVTPLVSGLLLGIELAANIVRDPSPDEPESVIGYFLVGLIFGAAMSAAIAWTLGVLAFHILRKSGLESRTAYALVGAAAGLGFGNLTADRLVAHPVLDDYLVSVPIGAISGVAFWLLRRGPDYRRAPKP